MFAPLTAARVSNRCVGVLDRFYATTTFLMVGMWVKASLMSSVITNLVTLVATAFAILLVDR